MNSSQFYELPSEKNETVGKRSVEDFIRLEQAISMPLFLDEAGILWPLANFYIHVVTKKNANELNDFKKI